MKKGCEPMEEYNEILTASEVAEILYIGKNAIYDLLNSGELPAFRIGRSWKIPRSGLEEYVIRKCQKSL